MPPELFRSVEFSALRRRLSLFAGDSDLRRTTLQGAFISLVAATLIFLGIKLLSPALFFDNHGRVVYWPIDGTLVAVMLMMRRRYWPWILLGSSVGQVISNISEPWPEICADALGNLIEPLIAACLLPAFTSLDDWMRQPRLVLRFIGGALILAPVVAGCGYALFGHLVYASSFSPRAASWISADVLGMTLSVPLVLILRSRETYELFRWRSLGLTVPLLGLVCVLTWLIFRFSSAPVAFVVLPLLLLVVFQLGFSGSVLAVNLMAIIVSSATLRGMGPFHLIPDGAEPYRMATLQLFLTMTMLMAFPVSVVLLERRRFEADLKAAYLRMERIATQDGLTGIPNRRRFDLALEQEWRRSTREARPLALLMIDADAFKSYNDWYGHLAGDECLRRLAQAIFSVPSRPADLVARYGGEEFAVLLPESGLAAASALADRIRLEVSNLNIEHQVSPYGIVTVSIGCAVAVPRAGWSSALLVARADQALYAAKLGGSNRVELGSPVEQMK